MRVDLSRVPVPVGSEPEVGNLYIAKGGRGSTAYWLVVARTPSNGCVLLGLDSLGVVVSSANYNSHAVKDRPLVGRVPGLDQLQFLMEVV